MVSYLTDENESETPDSIGGRQRGRQARQTPEGETSKSMNLLGKLAGVTGLETLTPDH